MSANIQISSRQFAVMVMIFTIGDGIAILPGVAVIEAKQDGWIAGLLSLLIGLFVVLIYEKVGRLYPQKTLVEANEKIFGTWLGKTVSLVFIGYAFYHAARALREIGDFLSTQNFPETPIVAIHVVFTVVVLMAVRAGIEPIARSSEVFLPWLVFLFLFLLVFLIPKMDLLNLQPVFHDGFSPILRGSLTFVTYPFVELVFFLMIVPYVKDKENLRKGWLTGAMLGGVVLLIITIVSILVLGPEITARQMYPGYNLAKKIIVGDFLQRVEITLAVIWFITIFIRVTMYFYVMVISIVQVCNLKDERPFIIPLGIILIPLTMVISPDVVYFNSLHRIWPFFDIAFALFYILILWFVAVFRKKWGNQEA